MQQVCRIEDAPAVGSNLGIAQASDLVLELPLAAAGPHCVGVRVAEGRDDHHSGHIDNLVSINWKPFGHSAETSY